MNLFSWSSMQTYADFPQDREKMIGYVNQLKWRYRIMFMPYSKHRNEDQNKLYHFLIWMIADYTWHTKDFLHEYYLDLFSDKYEARSSEMSESVFAQYLQTVIIHAYQNFWINYPPIYEYSFSDQRDTRQVIHNHWNCWEAMSDSPEALPAYE